MKFTTFSKKAFTLLELLLVAFIMAAVGSAVVPNFAKFVRNIEFQKTAEDMVSTIRFGQLRALTRGKWVQLKVDPSGYWLEEERSFNDDPGGHLTKPVFERLKNRHGRLSKFPEGVNVNPAQVVVTLSPDGRIQSSKLEICRRERCLEIETGQLIGHIRLSGPEQGKSDARS